MVLYKNVKYYAITIVCTCKKMYQSGFFFFLLYFILLHLTKKYGEFET